MASWRPTEQSKLIGITTLFFVVCTLLILVLNRTFISAMAILKLYAFFLLLSCLVFFVVLRHRPVFHQLGMNALVVLLLSPSLLLLYLGTNLAIAQPVFETQMSIKNNVEWDVSNGGPRLIEHNIPEKYRRLLYIDFRHIDPKLQYIDIVISEGVFGLDVISKRKQVR